MIRFLTTVRIKWSWPVVIGACIACGITFRLGLWQLDRADEKNALIAQWADKSERTPVPLDHLKNELQSPLALKRNHPESLHLLPVMWVGKNDASQLILLDNMMRGSRAGFHVLTPIETSIGWALLERGWIGKNANHYELPPVPPLETHYGIGHIHIPGNRLILADTPPTDSWPKIVQNIDFDQLSALTKKRLLPFTIRLNKEDNTSALDTNWPSLRLNPDKNYGYAVQWFLMSFALACSFFVSGLSKTSKIKKAPKTTQAQSKPNSV